MFNITEKTIMWGDAELTLQTGKVARQADGAVMVTYGGSTLLCTVTAAKKPIEGCDFLPMTVNYLEKAYSAGKIPGGFIKRETKPSDGEVLTSRLIDRPIRPLFAEGYHYDTQIICQLISFDRSHRADIPALIGASAALAISGLPFNGPIAGARVGYKDGEYLLNPIHEEDESELDLVVAGTADSVLMVESEAKLLSEEIMLGAVEFGHKAFAPVIEMIKEFAAEAGKPAMDFTPPSYDAECKKISDRFGADIASAYTITDKKERRAALDKVQDEFAVYTAETAENDANFAVYAKKAFKKVESDIVRGSILKDGTRIDGRGKADVRQIVSEAGVLPQAHGSALFTRGETQALVVTTLGTDSDSQIVDALAGEYRERFMLNYNFPPFSVGETGRMGAPGRREVGHGKLAWRALQAVLPDKEEFSYTMRVVSEITESNGSSSMATVCGASLALMDSGVPIAAPVSGIAMGLIKEGDDYVVLSDILGDEDHLGDMDFKVAGTAEGITALQMDIKIDGITFAIMKDALAQAKDGRLHILERMNEALQGPRDDVSPNAPRITKMKIDTSKIGAVIGPGGKIIKEICEVTGTSIDIADDGTVSISSVDPDATQQAKDMIEGLVGEPEVGKIYPGTVSKILDFGAVVTFMNTKTGLVHISELANERVAKVTDIVNEGDEVEVKVIGVDRGKVRLSIKRVAEEGEGMPEGVEERKPRRDRQGPRDDNDNRDRHGGNDEDGGSDNSGGRRKKQFF